LVGFSFRGPRRALALSHRGRLRHGRADRVQPAATVGDLAADDALELGHDAPGDLARAALADRITVHRADRSDLGRRAGHEQLVAGVELAARDLLLAHRDAEVAGDL